MVHRVAKWCICCFQSSAHYLYVKEINQFLTNTTEGLTEIRIHHVLNFIISLYEAVLFTGIDIVNQEKCTIHVYFMGNAAYIYWGGPITDGVR